MKHSLRARRKTQQRRPVPQRYEHSLVIPLDLLADAPALWDYFGRVIASGKVKYERIKPHEPAPQRVFSTLAVFGQRVVL